MGSYAEYRHCHHRNDTADIQYNRGAVEFPKLLAKMAEIGHEINRHNKASGALKTDEFEAVFGAVEQIGSSSNMTGVDGHFWMPQPLFRAAAAPDADLLVSVAMHGDGVVCPPPEHPHQACEAAFSKGAAADAPWTAFPGGPQSGNSVIRLNATTW
jgi:hypothetical protein